MVVSCTMMACTALTQDDSFIFSPLRRHETWPRGKHRNTEPKPPFQGGKHLHNGLWRQAALLLADACCPPTRLPTCPHPACCPPSTRLTESKKHQLQKRKAYDIWIYWKRKWQFCRNLIINAERWWKTTFNSPPGNATGHSTKQGNYWGTDFFQFWVNSPDGWPGHPEDPQSVLLNEHRILQY